ncbi:MAG: 4-hydroxy-3-methylbut-2-enyl diphosphate reductase [Bacteroidales bacterium]|nr:4-hydroxy-3-methylbut-2-enyl diphosphate reductase [Bacteroidales bacterium]
MIITIDKDAGFCFGVVRAIESAENELKKGKDLYCIGDVVHNELEINRLYRLGLKIINTKDLSNFGCKKVLIRAHGEPPSTYEFTRQHNIDVIDATCPIVLQLQKSIQKSWKEMQMVDGQVVIFGEKNHAEVIGLNGQTENQAIIIEKDLDLDQIDFTKPIRVFSQTTKSVEAYENVCQEIQKQASNSHNTNVKFSNSVCRSVSNRTKTLTTFSNDYDVIIFVSGKQSSNGRFLYSFCKKNNPKSHFVSYIEDLNPEWFKGAQSVGITGATSTPQWLMKQFSEAIEQICNTL